MAGSEEVIKNILKSVLKIHGIENKNILLKNTLNNVNLLVRIGGFLSRKLGMIFPGRILTVIGLKISFSKFIKTVNSVKNEII